jgi:hypothetical protein
MAFSFSVDAFPSDSDRFIYCGNLCDISRDPVCTDFPLAGDGGADDCVRIITPTSGASGQCLVWDGTTWVIDQCFGPSGAPSPVCTDFPLTGNGLSGDCVRITDGTPGVSGQCILWDGSTWNIGLCFGPTGPANPILTRCGLVGDGSTGSPIELEVVSAFPGVSGPAGGISGPTDGLLRNHFYSVDPCTTEQSNFRVQVPPGYGIVMGQSSNFVQNDVTVNGSAVLSGSMNRIPAPIGSSVVQSVIAGGLTNTIVNTTITDLENAFIGAGTSNIVRSDGGADSNNSFIGAGSTNVMSSPRSSIVGGLGNTVDTDSTSPNHIIGGGNLNTIGDFSRDSIIGAGASNTVGRSFNGAIVAGTLNTLSSAAVISNSMIGAGSGNGITGSQCFIGAGSSNSAAGVQAGILAGSGNDAFGTDCVLGGGRANRSLGSAAFVGAGSDNVNRGAQGFIGAGIDNLVDVAVGNAAIVGGTGNVVTTGAHQSFIGAGSENLTTTGVNTFVGAGTQNSATGPHSGIVCGRGNSTGSDSDFIGGGTGNHAGADNSVVCGGLGNRSGSVIGNNCFVGSGELNSALGLDCAIGGGGKNTASGTLSFIGGGGNNSVPADRLGNLASGAWSTVCGGGVDSAAVPSFANEASGDYSFVGGGGGTSYPLRNVATGFESGVVCGAGNQILGTGVFGMTGSGSFIGAGRNNSIEAVRSTILNGESNEIRSSASRGSTILNGFMNVMNFGCLDSLILGGDGVIINPDNTPVAFRRCIGFGQTGTTVRHSEAIVLNPVSAGGEFTSVGPSSLNVRTFHGGAGIYPVTTGGVLFDCGGVTPNIAGNTGLYTVNSSYGSPNVLAVDPHWSLPQITSGSSGPMGVSGASIAELTPAIWGEQLPYNTPEALMRLARVVSKLITLAGGTAAVAGAASATIA